jgi:hypothetical protein
MLDLCEWMSFDFGENGSVQCSPVFFLITPFFMACQDRMNEVLKKPELSHFPTLSLFLSPDM